MNGTCDKPSGEYLSEDMAVHANTTSPNANSTQHTLVSAQNRNMMRGEREQWHNPWPRVVERASEQERERERP